MSTGSSNASPSGGFWSGSTGQVSVRSTDSRIGDPPRQAREGWEWVWFPEGYWAERQLERRSSTKDSSGSQGSHSSQIQGTKTKVFRWTPRGSRSPRDQSDPPERPEPEQLNLSPKTVLPPNQNAFSHFTPPKHLPSSPYMSEEAQTLSLQNPDKKNKTTSEKLDTWTRFNSMTPPVTDLISPGSRPPTQPIRSKPSWRAFQKHREEEPKEEANEANDTEPELNSAPSYFSQKPIPPPQEPGSAEADETISEPEANSASRPAPAPRSRLRKWLMKLPGTRKRLGTPSDECREGSLRERVPGNSLESIGSTDSQIGFSNRPVLTEVSSKSTMVSKSTISYPAGEAMHVETPPLKHLTANGKPRSLFMDIKHPLPLEDESSHSPDSFSSTPRIVSYRNSQAGEKREWWDAPKRTTRRNPVKDVSIFEFDLPEHLPSSPMCPANPKHKGRGKLVCVYHGRAKQMSPDEDADEIEDEEEFEHRIKL